MEQWKDIEGFEGYYQVSNLGRIMSLDREVDGKSGGVRIIKGKVLKPDVNRGGYLQINLSKGNKQKKFSVHRLVYTAFCGEIPEGMQINHLDEDKTNNRLENLNLMTSKENVNFGTRTERAAKSKSKPVIALDEDGNVVLEFPSIVEGQRNGYDSGSLCNCCRGKLKTHRGLRWRYKEET